MDLVMLLTAAAGCWKTRCFDWSSEKIIVDDVFKRYSVTGDE